MNKKPQTLLIIGAGYQQIRAYQIAKEKGLFVVGTDVNPKAPAFDYADESLICCTRNINQTLEVVMEYAKNHPIDGVMTVANDVPLTVSTVAHALKLPSISIESAKLVSNKILMKEKLKQNNISVTDFIVLVSKSDFLKQVLGMGFPLILKPSDGRGSKGVLFLDRTIDLDWAWETCLAHCSNNELILEKFEEGPQISVEGLFIDKEFLPIAFADRNYDMLAKTKPYVIEDGGVIPSRFPEKELNKIAELIKNASSVLGIEWGSVKADIVLSQTGPKLIELAGRLSGGFLATHHIPRAYGIDIVKLVIELCLGESISLESIKPIIKTYIGVRYIFAEPGKIVEFEIPDFKNQKIDVDQYMQVGDIFPEIVNSGCTAGYVLAYSDNYQDAEKKAIEAINKITIKTEIQQ